MAFAMAINVFARVIIYEYEKISTIYVYMHSYSWTRLLMISYVRSTVVSWGKHGKGAE